MSLIIYKLSYNLGNWKKNQLKQEMQAQMKQKHF